MKPFPYLSMMLPLNEIENSRQSPFNNHFNALVKECLTEFHTPGIAVSVIEGGRTWAKGFGLASLPSEPVTPQTLFYAGSTTKSFTAGLVSVLVEDHAEYSNIQWETPLSHVIREDFILQDNYWTDHITFQDALSHRTGLPRHDFSWVGKTPREIVRSLRHLQMTEEPRTIWQYCNIMFIVVSHAIETIMSRPLHKAFRDYIWEPLGMDSTFLRLQDVQHSPKSQLAHGYWWNNDTFTFQELPWHDSESISGAGNIISNVLDYGKYIQMMIDGSAPFAMSSHEAIIAPHSVVAASSAPLIGPNLTGPVWYGLGWMSSIYRNKRLIFHGGNIDGFATSMAYLPEQKWGCVIMSNANSHVPGVVQWRLIDDYLHTPRKDRTDVAKLFREYDANDTDLESHRAELFPVVPSPPLPMTLPVQNYSGKYLHPAYRDIDLKLQDTSDDDPLLYLFLRKTSGEIKVTLHHVSGDYFLGYASPVAHSSAPEALHKVSFEINAAGEPSRLGIDLEPAMVDLTWFSRVI